MFSIAAINDADTPNEWHQPLAPTKEAQEFHLSQLYHDGLSRLQAKDYEAARELLESVLKDPLVSSAEVENSATDSHLLQLRFLALKNLASVFLLLRPSNYENALHCYLQAVEIDDKDSVVWNQLGTLSCSMGSLSISRWAFEQGLICSPSNWNCMEKLLEVLIAIGDEVACLSVAELILRHWPAHCRALHVKDVIGDAETVPLAPRGIDKLEPKHTRLKFPEKRKATDEVLNENTTSKRLKQQIEVQLSEASWLTLTGELLEILSKSGVKNENDTYLSGDIRLTLKLPSFPSNSEGATETRVLTCAPAGAVMNFTNCNSASEKEGITSEEQPQERRSTRLERRRSRKPGKEETEVSGKDLTKVVKQLLLPYIVDGSGTIKSHHGDNISSELVATSFYLESSDAIEFVRSTSNNFGAYHLGEMLLEKIASRHILYHDSMSKILDLEKLTRQWGQRRTKECSLFLAELYYDTGLGSSERSAMCSFMSEASYHLCKVIEYVALDYPFHVASMERESNSCQIDISDHSQPVMENVSLLRSNHCFWIRFYWLSSHLSRLEGDEEKAYKELSIMLSLFRDNDKMNSSPSSIFLPHCKRIKKLSVGRVLHEMNLVEVDQLLKKSVSKMLERNMHAECINILAPLLLSATDVYFDLCNEDATDGKEFHSVELTALDILIKSCELAAPMDFDIYLNSHRRKLQILLARSGIELSFEDTLGLDIFSTSPYHVNASVWKYWSPLIAEEVLAISQSALWIKSIIFADETFKKIPTAVIGDIQLLLVGLMCSVANSYFAQRPSEGSSPESIEQTEAGYFVDAAVAFCQLQHLDINVPIKSQAELIVAIHEMLAQIGICCARGNDSKEQEGTFLKISIKHLLTLDMKLKSNIQSLHRVRKFDPSNSKDENFEVFEQPSQRISLDVDVREPDKDEAHSLEKDVLESLNAGSISYHQDDRKIVVCGGDAHYEPDGMYRNTEIENDQRIDGRDVLTEDEREKLELIIDNALDQCFFCLYGLNLRSDSSCEDDVIKHKNTSQGDYQTKEQCADVFQYILPYAKASSRSGLVKLRRVLRAIRKHFPQPPDSVMSRNIIDKFLDNPEVCEDKLSENAGSTNFPETMIMVMLSENEGIKQALSLYSSEQYIEVYRNLYHLLAQSEDISATDKWAGFVLTKEGEEFVQQNANLFKYDLLYNPLRFESWQRLANIYDEEVDLLLNDGSKQINVLGWRKNSTLPQRVETSRRRSRRCLLMTLALAKTPTQQAEIHELLALVYYDGLQNVVPFYDQRSMFPVKNASWIVFCQNAMDHFKKAFKHKEDWSHAFYVGKLSEKLGAPYSESFSYYARAIALNPSAVDPFYRMHASRLKLLSKCGNQNEEALKVVAAHSFSQATKETITKILDGLFAKSSDPIMDDVDGISDSNSQVPCFNNLEKVWTLLYEDCLSALETCVEGDLKHFHKARYMIAQGLYRRGGTGDLERARDELSFCFKSFRSSFTINMWEIDSMIKKGRRKTVGPSGNRRSLEVNLAESSRKFITCIRKYILFYLKLLEETGDVFTLDRSYVFLRADKRFCLCLEDLVPVSLGRYIKGLISCIRRTGSDSYTTADNAEQLLERLFNLFLEQTNLWSDICSLPELMGPDWTEDSLHGYLYQYIQLLEGNIKVEALEGINEKIRKRLKNPKLSNSYCAKAYRHVSAAWCRSLVINMALLTPLHSRHSAEIHGLNILDDGQDNGQLLCVDLLSEELWDLAFEDPKHLKDLETKWNPSLSKIKNVIIKRVSDEDLETATSLLRSSYNFYKDTSCALLPSGINLYMVPAQLSTETYVQPGIDGVDILDMNTSRKLLLWAYSLVHGHCTSISHVIKYCEENAKSRMRKGAGASPTPSNPNSQTPNGVQPGGTKDGIVRSTEAEVVPDTNTIPNISFSSLPETGIAEKDSSSSPRNWI